MTEIIACNIRYIIITENTSFPAVIKLKQIVFKLFKIICSHLLIQNLKDINTIDSGRIRYKPVLNYLSVGMAIPKAKIQTHIWTENDLFPTSVSFLPGN